MIFFAPPSMTSLPEGMRLVPAGPWFNCEIQLQNHESPWSNAVLISSWLVVTSRIFKFQLRIESPNSSEVYITRGNKGGREEEQVYNTLPGSYVDCSVIYDTSHPNCYVAATQLHDATSTVTYK